MFVTETATINVFYSFTQLPGIKSLLYTIIMVELHHNTKIFKSFYNHQREQTILFSRVNTSPPDLQYNTCCIQYV